MSDLVCFEAFPEKPSVVSFSCSITPSIDYMILFYSIPINYSTSSYNDGDIIGAKVADGHQTIKRGNIEEISLSSGAKKEKGAMKNCCTFIIMYMKTKVNIKLFNNRFQICGVPTKESDDAKIIIQYVDAAIKKSKEDIRLLPTLSTNISESVTYDSINMNVLLSGKTDYVDIVHELEFTGTDMHNFTYTLPYLPKTREFTKYFQDQEKWEVNANNAKTVSIKLTYTITFTSQKVSFTISSSGKVTQSSSISREEHETAYRVLMIKMLRNYELLWRDDIYTPLVYEKA